MATHAREIDRGERFKFGENWSRFLSTVDDSRIQRAEASLKEMLEESNLTGKSFLDVGCGSGLFSLAARRLGARVHSFDYDPQSVACAMELKRRYYPDDSLWTIEEGSALAKDFVDRLGEFDCVYSWGVLHHTSEMWQALDRVSQLVKPGGKLFLAIYNDCGSRTARWRMIKRTYNQLPRLLQPPFALLVSLPSEAKNAARSVLRLRPQEFLKSWTDYDRNRGMSHWRDIVDWVGGYPYEVAKPEEIFEFYKERGFELLKLKCGNVGLGCNEFVFKKSGI